MERRIRNSLMIGASLIAVLMPFWYLIEPIICDIPMGGDYDWYVGPNYCFQSDSHMCINENNDPNCTYEIPWCTNVCHNKVQTRAYGSSMSRRYDMNGCKPMHSKRRSLNETRYSERLRAYYTKKRREYKQRQLTRRRNGNNRWQRTRGRIIGPRIVGGDDTYPGAFPWMARLEIDGITICGAVLVSRDTLLTAAHCLVETGYGWNGSIIMGEFNLTIQERYREMFDIKFGCVHPLFKKVDRGSDGFIYGPYDVAVIKLTKNVIYSKYVQPICRFRSDQTIRPKYHGNCIGLGMGDYIAYHNSSGYPIRDEMSERLNYLGLDRVECPSEFGWFDGTVNCYQPWKIYKELESKGSRRFSGCFGDYGGPVACFDPFAKIWYVEGVMVFFDTKCGEKKIGYHAVFDLWKYREEIENMIFLKTNNTAGDCWRG